ncbi:MAG: gamma-glutamyltransferase, partial [Xanthobacteraceae bacterium]
MPNLKILPRRFCSLSLIVAAILPVAALAQDDQIPPAQGVLAQNGMVVAQESRAARIGNDILQRGGNAVDAAVAVGFALAVSYPRAGNLGGGGFMVIHLANVTDTTIDYRETAPSNINSKSFLDAQGNADPQKSRDSALAVGVPGTVAGLALAEDKYGSGRFTLAQLIAPAMQMARDGFTFEDDRAEALPNERARLVRWPSTVKIFFKADGNPVSYGDRLVQGDLAETLDAIAREGPSAFYEGPIADEIAAAVQAAGGVMTADDLKSYTAFERTPVRGTYRGYGIVSMPPPSSGGVELIEMLNILEGYDLGHQDAGQAAHLMVEAMKRAYADRALFLGDPDQVKAPVEKLISKDYAATWRATIDPEHATPASAIRPGGTVQPEGRNTTHFSVVDSFGNAVSNTYTLNFSYGVGLVAEGTGIVLNNELDDFAVKPDAPNAYGLIGYEANAPGPGKRPLSSMTPTILLKDGKPFL